MSNNEVDPYPCAVCGEPITAYELCVECAKGNDPFAETKYEQEGDHPWEDDR